MEAPLQDGTTEPRGGSQPGPDGQPFKANSLQCPLKGRLNFSGLFPGHSGCTRDKCWSHMTIYDIINKEHHWVSASQVRCLSSLPDGCPQSHNALRVQVLLPVYPPRGSVKLRAAVFSAPSGITASLCGASMACIHGSICAAMTMGLKTFEDLHT